MRPVLTHTRLCVAALALATVLLGSVETSAQNRPTTGRKVTARGTEKREKRQPRTRVPKRTSKRALLVLLENDGMAFVLTQLKGMKGVQLPKLPYMCYQGKGGKLELKLRKNENVVSAIARLNSTISRHATQCAGKKPKSPKKPRVPYFQSPPAPPKVPNPASPTYVRALGRYTKALAKYTADLAQYNARVAKNFADFLNPTSWSMKTMTTTDAARATNKRAVRSRPRMEFVSRVTRAPPRYAQGSPKDPRQRRIIVALVAGDISLVRTPR
jgi:hypothetical protein